MRASDAERDTVASALGHHAAEGRLTLEELAQRVERAYGATTRDELAELTRDLPEQPVAATERRRLRPTTWSVAVMSGINRRGRWRLPESSHAIAIMGGLHLDLRSAEIDDATVTINAVTIMGGIDITVPEGVEVALSGFALMGGKDFRPSGSAPPPGAPLVHVKAFALMGGINVRSRPPLR